MKILVLTHYYEPEIGAPQRRWSAMVSRWQQAGHEVTVCCPPPHYPDKVSTAPMRSKLPNVGTVESGKYGEKIMRVPYLLHGFSSKTRLADQLVSAVSSAIYGLWSISIKREKYDAVIATVPGLPSLIAGSILSSATGTPLVTELRDAWPDVVTGDIESATGQQNAPVWFLKKSIHTVVTGMQKHSAGVITTTDRFADILRARGVQNVFSVPNGADYCEFACTSPVKETSDSLKILYVGTVGRSQDLQTAVKALAKVREMDPTTDYRLRIVGDGAQKKPLELFSALRGIPVEFMPVQPRENLGELYAWADVTLASLKNTKPFEWTVPSKIYELLLAQRFVIAQVRGEAADIVENSGGGAVLTPESVDELVQCWYELAHDRSRLVLDDAPAKYVLQNFDYDLLAQRYLHVLEESIGARSKGLVQA